MACAERGIRCHLLVRGYEQQLRKSPPVGYHLLARMLAAEVTLVGKGEYADREAMFARHAARIQAGLSAGTKVRDCP